MTKTYLYLPEELNQKINEHSSISGESKAKTIRKALAEGLSIMDQKNNRSFDPLLRIIELNKDIRVTGPVDLSTNLDYYLWDTYYDQE